MQNTATAPDPSQIDTWIFDLDNTLYPASSNLFDQINQRMWEFMGKRLGFQIPEAQALQKRYAAEHGSTLRGLMNDHGMDPQDFLDHVHDIDLSVLSPDPGLDAALQALPGRKVIFTSGSDDHVANVLGHLGMTRHFEAVFDIHAADYRPKPHPPTYRRMVERFGLDPTRAIFFDDIPRNLEPAAALGIATAWIANDRRDAATAAEQSYVHHVIEDLGGWLSDLLRS